MQQKHSIKCHWNETKLGVHCTCDGYHTFDELYEHRYTLFLALCKEKNLHVVNHKPIWRSKLQSDSKMYEGYFIMGIGKDDGDQMTYHLPMKYWEECDFAETLDLAPDFDGHTSEDVLKRLSNL